MRTVAKPEGKRKRAQEVGVDRERLEAKVALIQALIPLGLEAWGRRK
jgi:hypothetical protein